MFNITKKWFLSVLLMVALPVVVNSSTQWTEFTATERNLIPAYYAWKKNKNEKDKKPADNQTVKSAEKKKNTKKNPQLTRGKILSEHVVVQDLPAELIVKLPSLPEDYQRVQVGNDVILLEKNTRRIIDILKDVVQ